MQYSTNPNAVVQPRGRMPLPPMRTRYETPDAPAAPDRDAYDTKAAYERACENWIAVRYGLRVSAPVEHKGGWRGAPDDKTPDQLEQERLDARDLLAAERAERADAADAAARAQLETKVAGGYASMGERILLAKVRGAWRDRALAKQVNATYDVLYARLADARKE